MSAKNFKSQLLRDLQASWRKTALLAGLFVVGLAVWLPPLFRSIGRRDAAPATGDTSRPATVKSSIPSEAGPRETLKGDNSRNWQTVDRLLASDPLIRTANLALLPRDPFQINVEQFPLPVLLAEEPPPPPRPVEPPKVAKVPEAVPPPRPPDLTLVSTIVGSNRRAAYIDNKLYFEGSRVEADGRTFQVVSILPRRVVLRQGTQDFELTIAQ